MYAAGAAGLSVERQPGRAAPPAGRRDPSKSPTTPSRPRPVTDTQSKSSNGEVMDTGLAGSARSDWQAVSKIQPGELKYAQRFGSESCKGDVTLMGKDLV